MERVATPDVATGRVADAFVFRRVARGRHAHVGGLGRGEGWAGIVSLVEGETPDTVALPATGGVQVHRADEPVRRFGPYWSAFLVVVRLSHDVVVAFGGPEPVEADDATWHATAERLAARVTRVTPAKRLADELELLHAVRDVALIPPGGVEEVGGHLLERLTGALSCEVGGLLLPDGTLLVHVEPVVEVEAGLVRLALRSLLHQHAGESTCQQDARGAVEGSWLRSYLVRQVGDGIAVVVGHTAAAPRGFTDLCQQLADSTTAAAATVLRAAQQYEAVRERAALASAEARSDALTGLSNRRAWDEAVERHGDDETVGVVVCDLDGLKDVNDRFGHAVGDHCLQVAAEVLRGAVREGDVVARLGGDEFVLMLPGADDDQARRVVDRIHAACRDVRLPDGHEVSMSVGVAVGHGTLLTALLERADATMYHRKRASAAAPAGGGEDAAAARREDCARAVGPDVVQPVVSEILRVLLQLPPSQLDDGIQQALASLGLALQLDRTYVFRIDGETCSNTHEWCAPGITAEIDNCQDLPLSMLGDWMPAFEQGQAVHVPDVATLTGAPADLRDLLAAQDIRSLLLVPMSFEGEVVGFVGFDAVRTRRTFGEMARGLLGTVGDVLAAATARQQASLRVERAESRAVELLRHSRDHILLLDARGRVYWASESFQQLGASPGDLVGRAAVDLVHPEDSELIQQLVAMWLRTSTPGDLVLPDHRAVLGGQTRWWSVVVRDARSRPGIEGLILAGHDVTERREQTEQLRHQALHDDLTGLPNRALVRDRLEVALHRAARNHGHVGVLFLGLDGFKLVNDSRSHAVGDQMLGQIAGRLQDSVRGAETAGRFGGDQFVVVIEVDEPTQVHRAIERIIGVFDAPFTVGGQPQSMSASFGLRIAETGELDPDAVLRDADNALFAAKARGRGRLVTFDPRMRERAVRQDVVGRRLPGAIANGDIIAHYQPLVDLGTGRILGAEALARWTDAELGEVHPTEFITVAEGAGVIEALGTHVLRTACRAAASWPEPAYVSVNLSPSQLEDDDLPVTVVRALEDAGLPPWRLVLEVTESVLMRDTARAVAHLQQLRRLGVRVALDDFGTGHSSLAVLRDLPLDILKIDRSFIVRMQQDDRGGRMVDGIVSLAEDLGLVTVAEGVETAGQAARLRRAGCHVAQGWLFGHPSPIPAFPRSTMPLREATSVGSLQPAAARTASAGPRRGTERPA